jgi:hypothetical protein
VVSTVCHVATRLLAAELLDLLEFGLGPIPRHVVLGDLRALHMVADVLDDLGVGQGGDVPDVGGGAGGVQDAQRVGRCDWDAACGLGPR